ncbi:MAG: hypothetical protein AB7J35_10010 [Dehalococcoidia bacterium]
MPLTPKDLLDLSQTELDELFRSSEAGPIPAGEAAGTVIMHPGTVFADIAAEAAEAVAWQGKVFDPATKTLKNKVTAAGVQEVQAAVDFGESWFDQKKCIVLDYSKTSTVARAIRDEIRQVAPGVYLGIVFIGDKKTINFALDFNNPGSRQGLVTRLISGIRKLFRRGR